MSSFIKIMENKKKINEKKINQLSVACVIVE